MRKLLAMLLVGFVLEDSCLAQLIL
uniref:Uncharacterized protein n=1 Tax=Arundo donax TaxID=35708 RepID=A0A0A9DPV7_ARUDO